MNRKYLIKPLLISLLAGVSLTACNSGTSQTTSPNRTTLSSEHLKGATDDDGIELGTPAVVISGTPYPMTKFATCLKDPLAGSETVNFQEVGSEFNFRKNMTIEETLDKLGLKADLSAQVSSSSGNIAGEYEKAHTDSKLEYKVSFYGYKTGTFSLSKPALASKDDAKLSTCGTGFVAGGTGGIYYDGSIIVKFTSLEDRLKLDAAGALNVPDVVELAAGLAKAQEKKTANFEVYVEVVQRGGDSSRIFDTFKGMGLKNLGKEIYLAQLGPDNMKEAAIALQNYIETDLITQAQEIPKIKDVEEFREKVAISTVKYADYSNSSGVVKRSRNLQNAITKHDGAYQDLFNTKVAFNQYKNYVEPFAPRSDALTNVKNAKTTYRDLDDQQETMFTTAKSCYGYIEPNSDEEKECIEWLTEDKADANLLVSTIDATNWSAGYVISGTGAKSEALIPITGGTDGSLTSFVSMAVDISNAHFFPGTEYTYNKETKELVPGLRVIALDDDSDFKTQNRFIKYKGVDSISAGKNFIATSVDYFSEVQGELVESTPVVTANTNTSYKSVFPSK